MPVPAPATFARLTKLAAIAEPGKRDQRSIHEVFTGAELAVIPVGEAADVESAFAKARAAQSAWAARPVNDRAQVLQRFEQLVDQRASELMDVCQAETGKSRAAAQEEVIGLVLAARYFAHVAPGLLAPQHVPGMLPALTKVVVHYQPKGVVGVIAPWNYPMLLAVGDALPALAAGNAVVVKPDSQTPFSTLAAAELLYEAGLPRDLLPVVPGPGSVVGRAIVDSCDYLMFTGSTDTGRKLAQQCGQRLTGFSAELGGKNAMIITAGANYRKAAKSALRACFSNAGQLCISIERIYIADAIAPEFIRRFSDNVQSMKLGTGYDFNSDMGSLISADQLKTVTEHVEDAKAKGATVIAGGSPRPDIGPLFFEPTVLTGVAEGMKCYRDETFGPVVSIYPVADTDEAIRRANDTDYGLNSSVWAMNSDEAESIAVRLRTGTVNINEGYAPAWGSTAAPMGGMRNSGVGRRHGPDGLLKFTEPQSIVTTRLQDMDPPPGVSTNLWQQALRPVVKAVGYLPGR